MMNYHFNLTDKEKSYLDSHIELQINLKSLSPELTLTAIQAKLDSIGDTSNIKAPVKYLERVIDRLIEEDTDKFRKKKITVNANGLYRALNELGFTGSDIDKYLIGEIEEYVINESNINASEMIALNQKVIDYCIRRKNKTYDFYVKLLLTPKNKTLKCCNIPVEELRKRVQAMIDEFNRLFDELEQTDNPIPD